MSADHLHDAYIAPLRALAQENAVLRAQLASAQEALMQVLEERAEADASS